LRRSKGSLHPGLPTLIAVDQQWLLPGWHQQLQHAMLQCSAQHVLFSTRWTML
jgi:hypothetical protein